jgi:hypothetical protein
MTYFGRYSRSLDRDLNPKPPQLTNYEVKPVSHGGKQPAFQFISQVCVRTQTVRNLRCLVPARERKENETFSFELT